MPDPHVSVIVPAYNAAGTIRRSLEALANQSGGTDYEVIVVDSGTDDTEVIVRDEFPEVKLLHFDERKFCGAARNAGLRHARGRIFAFTDADCIAAPDWVEQVARAHEGDRPVIGGAIDNANPSSWLGWGYYFAEFNNWLPGSTPRFVDDMAGCCWSMKRWVYDRYGPFDEQGYCSDSIFHWRMRAQGLRPFFEPAVRVAHLNPTDWQDLIHHEPLHGSHYARARVRHCGLPTRRIAFHAGSAPLLPLLLVGRALRNAARSKHGAARFAWTAPIVFMAIAAWSWGELTGYVAELRDRRLAPS